MYLCICATVFGSSGAARADIIQLSSGQELTVIFAVPGFSAGNTASLPTTVSVELAGFAAPGAATGAIPGSSADYYPSILLQGSLQSLNGAISLPLFDADSWRLGMSTGNLVADSSSGGGATVYADAALSLTLAQSIFGTSGEAEFVIQNEGSALTIGLGPGYSLANAILVPLSADNGAVDTAGYILSTQTSSSLSTSPHLTGSQPTVVPEPSGLGAAIAGGAIVFWLRRRIRSN
jgi:hypothetical protein